MNYADFSSSKTNSYEFSERFSQFAGLTCRIVATTAAIFATLAPQNAQASSQNLLRPTLTTAGNSTLVERRPSTASSDSLAEGLLYPVMSNPIVADFKQRIPSADLGAIQGILNLAIQNFSGPRRLDTCFSIEEEETGPALFLSLETYGMDFDEQLQRELRLRESILSNARLAAAKRYVVIAVA